MLTILTHEMKIARKKLVTGPTKPGYIIDRSLIRGQEINPFGCVDVLIDTVFYKHRLYSFPVNFRWFHFTERERERRTKVSEKRTKHPEVKKQMLGRERLDL